MHKSHNLIRNNQFLIVLLYRYICNIYQIFSTLYENIFFRKSVSKNNFLNTGIFSIDDFNNSFLEELKDVDSKYVNRFLSIKIISNDQLDNLVRSVFNEKMRKKITHITGFSYSIDYMIFYDRKFIPEELRKVSTLKQAYSYRWHFDKPNSRNMLKIFIPFNITDEDGPLEVIDKKESKQIRDFNKINFGQKRTFFVGSKDSVFGFLPTTCCHRDGIPKNKKVATQIMFQLNPHKKWVINSKLFYRDPSLNNKLGIWTTEPKFPFFAYLFDKRVDFNN